MLIAFSVFFATSCDKSSGNNISTTLKETITTIPDIQNYLEEVVICYQSDFDEYFECGYEPQYDAQQNQLDDYNSGINSKKYQDGWVIYATDGSLNAVWSGNGVERCGPIIFNNLLEYKGTLFSYYPNGHIVCQEPMDFYVTYVKLEYISDIEISEQYFAHDYKQYFQNMTITLLNGETIVRTISSGHPY